MQVGALREAGWGRGEERHENRGLCHCLGSRCETRGITDSETIEGQLFHPAGPGSAEQVLCRLTMTDLNALVEAALQSTLLQLRQDSLSMQRRVA